MLDIKRIRKDPEELRRAMAGRGKDVDVEGFLEIEARRRALLGEVEALKARRNEQSARVPLMKKAGEDTAPLLAQMKLLADQIKELDSRAGELDAHVEAWIMGVPNIPGPNTPIGREESDNREIRRVGEPPRFGLTPQAHWDIGESLGILDFATAGKISGARFNIQRGAGARLTRAVIALFLDIHTRQSGYLEIAPPYMVNRASMTGTGQLPKFEEDAFRVADTDYFLVPTAEVPVTNIHRDDIIEAARLPIKYTAYSENFRSEAGSAGRDTRGLIRQHQFSKVELVQFVHPDESYAVLETLTLDAEKVLGALELPYRVVNLCTGDIGFSAAQTYDIEVWMPSYNRYVEISSSSNFEDFQARRANIRYRDESGKLGLVHTLNASGVAVGRAVAAILENYQNEDGTVTVPEALRCFMGIDKIEAAQ